MRRLFVALLIGAASLFGVAAHAGSLADATLSFTVGTLPSATFPATGATGTSTSNLQASVGAGNAFNGTFTTTIPTSAAPPLTKLVVKVTGNEGGNFTGAAPATVGGNAKFLGVSEVYGVGGSKLLDVPLGFGTPGTVFKSGGGVNITVINAAWTAGTAEVTGTDNGTATAMGENLLAGNGDGMLKLVTPVKIRTNVAGTIAAFGVLDLVYGAPEPALPLMLLAGAATLGAVGFTRRRR